MKSALICIWFKFFSNWVQLRSKWGKKDNHQHLSQLASNCSVLASVYLSATEWLTFTGNDNFLLLCCTAAMVVWISAILVHQLNAVWCSIHNSQYSNIQGSSLVPRPHPHVHRVWAWEYRGSTCSCWTVTPVTWWSCDPAPLLSDWWLPNKATEEVAIVDFNWGPLSLNPSIIRHNSAV